MCEYAEPKPRKIKHRAHKCFGLHSRLVTQSLHDACEALGCLAELKGHTVGDKQIHPDNYHKGDTKRARTPAEIRNAELRK